MNAPFLKSREQLGREPEVFKRIPYVGHVSRYSIELTSGDYAQVIKLDGVSFETVDDEVLNRLHRFLNDMIRGIASPNITIWHHLVRRKQIQYPEGEYPEGFARDFNEKYREKICSQNLMVNELYLAIIYRPIVSGIGKKLSKFLSRGGDEQQQEDVSVSCEKLDHIVAEVVAALPQYEPRKLGIYEHNEVLYSEAYSFLGFLVNQEWNRVPVLRSSLSKYLAVSRPLCGNEIIEIRQASKSIYGAALGYTAYPNKTPVGCYNALLTAPYQFIMAQSFSFITKGAASYIIKTSRDRMINTEDDAISQIVELDELLDDLASNKVVMGDHHISLFVFEDSPKKIGKAIDDIRPFWGNSAATVAREDLGLEAAFWAILPGNFAYRPRLSPITSRNFAAMCSMHNFPAGRIEGNHWGPAISLFKTSANTPLYVNLHASDPHEKDGGKKKDVGHTLALGPTGSGKTATIGVLLTLLQKFLPTLICFTKDKDLFILIKALGGKYLSLEKGKPTGCNPFQLPNTPRNVQFWNDLVCSPTLLGRDPTTNDVDEIKEAINWVATQPVEMRSIGRLLDHMDASRPDGVYRALRQWCYARSADQQDGLYAWVLDNKQDTVAKEIGSTRHGGILGIDVTEFLDMPTISTPLNMYFFHLVDEMTDGRRIGIIIAEFWKSLGTPAFRSRVENMLNTIRKNNGFVCLDSQHPDHALKSEISASLVGQTATKILFPNPDAKPEDYIDGLNCSKREFDLLKNKLKEGSGTFLIKQGRNSVVAKLDLTGFEFELDVISGRKHNIQLVEQLIARHGDEPAAWLEKFREERQKS